MADKAIKTLATNRRAHHDYAIEETIECGIELRGTEVKSFRAGALSFPDAFALVEKGEVWLQGLHVSEYSYSSIFNHDPDRKKKLLLHAQEITRLARKVQEKGYTLIPLQFYLKDGRVKVALGVCKGKKQYDKRADIKTRETDREISREIRSRNKRD
jgi:SsrA-binding protein